MNMTGNMEGIQKMKKLVLFLLVLTIALAAGAAAADETELLGKTFENFTATDTEGNTFNLSEALDDHEAVLINLWATWCPPCRNEMPYLQQLWENYGDRVAVIALSTEPNDTTETIAAFREEYGITFPMGRDENNALASRLNAEGIPDTLIVDRFGIVGFCRVGMFFSYGDLERTVNAFLGDGDTESRVLTDMPKNSSTIALPAAVKRTMHVENEGVKKIVFHFDEETEGQSLVGYIVPDGKAKIRLELATTDNPESVIYNDIWNGYFPVTDLLDPQHGELVYEQETSSEYEDVKYNYGYGYVLNTESGSDDPELLEFFLVSDEKYIDEIMQELAASGMNNITWEYVEETVGDTLQAYIIHVVDQNGAPVAGAVVNFCTDTACVPSEADENGLITFDGAPDRYHMQLIDLPEGYSSDEDFEMYTEAEYGEWVLRVKKD